MRLTIIPSDQAVYVDGECRVLDLASCEIPVTVHALQWYDVKGWIEFIQPDPFTDKSPNQDITELPNWANCCVTKWQEWVPPTLPSEPAANQPTTSGTQTL